MIKSLFKFGAVAAALFAISPDSAYSTQPKAANNTAYRTISVDGLNIFYREAGPRDAPAILLLHGFPSSSRMFEPLFALLRDR